MKNDNHNWRRIIFWILTILIIFYAISEYRHLKAEKEIFQNRVATYCKIINQDSELITKLSPSIENKPLDCNEVSNIDWNK